MTGAAIKAVITPKGHDIGAFEVRRSLPSKECRSVGPFVFLDGFGPAVLPADKAMDVRPHPHIGLATITWLLEGEITHRDSLGSAQVIRPGACNWMTAGRGIVHSERSPDHLRGKPQSLFGMQAWIALPQAHEEVDPAFEHIPASDLPVAKGPGFSAVVIAGSAWGVTSPVALYSKTLYAEVTLNGVANNGAAGASLTLTDEVVERGLYILEGGLVVDGQALGPHQLVVFHPGVEVQVTATVPTRFMVLGGDPLDGPRHLFWNFVSSSKARIDQAKQDWKAGRFAKVPGDEKEFIPLPD